MARIKLFVPLIIFLALAALLYLGLGHDPRELPSALVDRPMPAFALPALGDDKPLDQTLFRGSPRLLNVWATWCSACRDEHPFLVELARAGVPIVGLDYKDDPAAARRWLAVALLQGHCGCRNTSKVCRPLSGCRRLSAGQLTGGLDGGAELVW